MARATPGSSPTLAEHDDISLLFLVNAHKYMRLVSYGDGMNDEQQTRRLLQTIRENEEQRENSGILYATGHLTYRVASRHRRLNPGFPSTTNNCHASSQEGKED